MEVAEGVFRYGSRFHNWYLVEDGGKFTGVDAGCSKDWAELASAMAVHGKTPDDLEAVVLTHGHADHVGFAATAHAHGIDVKIHEDDEFRLAQSRDGYSVGLTDMPLWRPRVIAFLATLVRHGVTTVPKLEGAETFHDDDVLDVPGRPRVLHTPGHTEGHSAFVLEDRGILFTGDSLVSMGLFEAHDGPQMMPDVFHTDAAQARESLSRLADLNTTVSLPGHGDPLEGSIADHIAAALK